MDSLYIIFWFSYILAIIIGAEIFGYVWHRYGAHDDYIPGIHTTHQIHHISEHDADEDFVWILFMMITLEFILGLCVMTHIIPGVLALITIIVSLIVFWWNWWIHKAYHNPNHWLNSYTWFQREKYRHYIHHYNPQNNFGIASHFVDRIVGTWIDPIKFQ